MGDRSLARLIRKRRDALGLSQARLGELVGRSASTIRNWERGNSTPSERSDAVALAAILGLDEREVLERAGFDVGATDEKPTIEQSYASLAPEVADGPPSAAQDGTDTETDEDEETVREADQGGEAVIPATPGPDPAKDEDDAAQPVIEDEAADTGGDLEIEPDPVPEPARAGTDFEMPVPEIEDEGPSTPPPADVDARQVARAAPPTVLETQTPPEPSYLEDPGERQRYRVRAVATAALIIALVIVFMWSFGRATDALGSMWDEFFGMLDV